MSRVRVSGLVALGVLAVVLYLVAPEDGRFSQTPTLVLVGVIALLWHLAWTDGFPGRRAPEATVAEEVPSADGASTAGAGSASVVAPALAPALAFESAGSSERAVGRDEQEDLSLLPDPPADWPPPGVEVPMVFRAESVEPVEPVEAKVIDLTDRSGSDTRRIDLTPGSVAPTGADAIDRVGAIDRSEVSDASAASLAAPDSEDLGDHDSSGSEPDPWLAFAAAMFRDD